MCYKHGILANLSQFNHQLFQVFLIGLTIGLQRNIVPVLAEVEFGVSSGSYTYLTAFVISFGFVKGIMNFVAGNLSEKHGRKRVLVLGWIIALPIPFIFLYAPNWNWIIAANILLGMNQGFSWSMTVTSKIDITRAEHRGFATGLNEFLGYGGVAIAGVVTGYLANDFDPRWTLFSLGLFIILVGLTIACIFIIDTLPWAKAESKAHSSQASVGPIPRFPKNVSKHPSANEVFMLVSFKNRTFSALSQAGCVEKFVDALVWVFFPLFFYQKGLTIIDIGWIVGSYGMVWGASQLWTGPLSDAIGRKLPIILGMWICSIGVIATIVVEGFFHWMATAAITGIGMALLYPTLIAAVGDISHPNWRGSSLGVYRFWRDVGYGIGALSLGIVAEITGKIEAGFILTAILMALSGLWTLFAAEETHPRLNPMTKDKE